MSFRTKLRRIVAGAPSDPTDHAAALINGGYALYLLKLENGEHVGLGVRQRGALADAWGQRVTGIAEVRRLLAENPNALAGVARGNDRAVVNLKTGKIENPRERVNLSVHRRLTATPISSTSPEIAAKPLPQPPSIAEATAAVQVALNVKAQLRIDVDARHRAMDTIEAKHRSSEHALVKERKRFGDEAVDAVTRGKDVPELPLVRKAIMKHEAEIAAYDAARPSALEQLKMAKVKLEEHAGHFAAAALDLDAALTAAALPPLVHRLSRLADPLAELVAVSLIREQLLGPRFTFDRRLHAPIGARQIAAAFVEVVPPALRTEALTVENIEARAEEIAAVHLAQLESPTPKEN